MKIQNKDATVTAEVEPGLEAVRTVFTPQAGIGFSCTGITGAFAGGVPAANAAFWALRNGFDSPSRKGAEHIIIDRIRIKITGTNVTAGSLLHRIGLFRGSNSTGTIASVTGGTAITPANKHSLARPNIGSTQSISSDLRLSSTTALTTTNFTFETNPIRSFQYGHIQPTGAFGEITWELHDSENQGLHLMPGQVAAIRVIVATNGTSGYCYQVDADWREVSEIPLPIHS